MTEEKFVEEIKNRMNTQDLHISRIPMRTKRWFIDYAKDYFCSDYGMALTFVCQQSEEYHKAKEILFSLVKSFKNGNRR